MNIYRSGTARSAGLLGALFASASLSLAVGGNAAADVLPSASPDLPVLGSTVITEGRGVGGVRVQALVHGVRRVPGATVLYFSVGLPEGAPDVSWLSIRQLQAERRFSSDGTDLGAQQLVDLTGARVYTVLVDAEKNALASPRKAWPDRVEAGQFYTMYEVLPELPASLSQIDVMIGNQDAIHNVPVSDGVMEPAVEQTGPLLLGQGWPKIDLAAAQKSLRPQDSIRRLEIKSSDQQRTVTARRTDKGAVSVDLSADVLFAVDSATLGAAAAAKVAKAAEQINAQAAAGQIRVVGHTDGEGSPAHNLDLSKRRAQSVVKLLTPLVTVAGMTFEVEGRGETQPVATNSTAAGRKENRRVSVVFTPKERQ